MTVPADNALYLNNVKPAKNFELPKETVPADNGLYHEPHASEFTIVKASDGNKTSGVVTLVNRRPFLLTWYVCMITMTTFIVMSLVRPLRIVA